MFNLLFIISRTIDSIFFDLVVLFIDDRTLLYFFIAIVVLSHLFK